MHSAKPKEFIHTHSLCAAHIAEDSQQVSSLTVSKNRLASTPIPSPQHSTSRSVPLLLLNDTNSTDQISSSKLPCNDAPSPSNLARLDFLMGMTAPLDPKKGPPELLATYPGGIHDTVSISLSSRLHNRGITSTSSTQGTLNIDLLDRDIPTLSIESCDADHPSTEEPPTAGYGFDWMTWEEFTSCNFNTLEQ
ncbi:uncharacterized protein EAE97_006373 [Botrytis byssoidea]|uniref:Uncharacterized protein n=1 Tax=Botrytis byssoidea TaxID=139641 RepID=A0A9P5IQJ2_9HELO|nr:uncharacterized protein EAE97_006373 [Botrytis byssoidea]KAF7942919.1 hypothetical protein EAE97_006373 [Botrytis byssoidea]